VGSASKCRPQHDIQHAIATLADQVVLAWNLLSLGSARVITVVRLFMCRGSVQLRNVTVNSFEMDEVICPHNHTTIQPGDSLNCTGTYNVKPSDLDRSALYFYQHAASTTLQPDRYPWYGPPMVLNVLSAHQLVLDVLGDTCHKIPMPSKYQPGWLYAMGSWPGFLGVTPSVHTVCRCHGGCSLAVSYSNRISQLAIFIVHPSFHKDVIPAIAVERTVWWFGATKCAVLLPHADATDINATVSAVSCTVMLANRGSVMLYNVTVSDADPGCQDLMLWPGQTFYCTATRWALHMANVHEG